MPAFLLIAAVVVWMTADVLRYVDRLFDLHLAQPSTSAPSQPTRADAEPPPDCNDAGTVRWVEDLIRNAPELKNHAGLEAALLTNPRPNPAFGAARNTSPRHDSGRSSSDAVMETVRQHWVDNRSRCVMDAFTTVGEMQIYFIQRDDATGWTPSVHIVPTLYPDAPASLDVSIRRDAAPGFSLLVKNYDENGGPRRE